MESLSWRYQNCSSWATGLRQLHQSMGLDRRSCREPSDLNQYVNLKYFSAGRGAGASFIPSPEFGSKPRPSSRRLPNFSCHFPLVVLVLELLQVKVMQKSGGPKHHHGFGPHLVQLGAWGGALCLAVCPHGMWSWLSPSLEMTGPGLSCTPQSHPFLCDWFRLLTHLWFSHTFLRMLRAI